MHYEYTLRDHLGNGRVYISDRDRDGSISQAEILQIESYYPFGMAHGRPGSTTPATPNAYTYNGKELNTDFSLNLSNNGHRFYDNKIGRFIEVDPISEQFMHVSTYNYAENQVVNSIDLHGLQAWKVITRHEYVGTNTKWEFDPDLEDIGQVYTVHEYYDKTGFMESLTWGSESFENFPDQFPNGERADGRGLVTLETSVGFVYGEVSLKDSKIGEVSFGADGNLISHDTKIDVLNLKGEQGYNSFFVDDKKVNFGAEIDLENSLMNIGDGYRHGFDTDLGKFDKEGTTTFSKPKYKLTAGKEPKGSGFLSFGQSQKAALGFGFQYSIEMRFNFPRNDTQFEQTLKNASSPINPKTSPIH